MGWVEAICHRVGDSGADIGAAGGRRPDGGGVEGGWGDAKGLGGCEEVISEFCNRLLPIGNY